MIVISLNYFDVFSLLIMAKNNHFTATLHMGSKDMGFFRT